MCKISSENGQAIYLTLGSMGPTDALDALDAMVGKVAEWSNFIKGLPARKRLDEPVNQLLLNIAGITSPTEGDLPLSATSETPETNDAPIDEVIVGGAEVSAAQINTVTHQVIDLIGPFGIIITEKTFST